VGCADCPYKPLVLGVDGFVRDHSDCDFGNQTAVSVESVMISLKSFQGFDSYGQVLVGIEHGLASHLALAYYVEPGREPRNRFCQHFSSSLHLFGSVLAANLFSSNALFVLVSDVRVSVSLSDAANAG
jgi:hypothetical protein